MKALFSDTFLILWLQHFSPTLGLPFTLITALGSESFFLLFLPVVYWCVHRRIGAGLAILFLISASVNAIAKALIGMPRPFAVDSSVMQLETAGGNGFPSGHTQGAMVVWSYLSVRFKKTWLWWLAVAMILLIPLSRFFLGVHFPVDLAGGYLIGGLLAIYFGLKIGCAGMEPAWLLRFVRYGLVGLWIAAGAPLLFHRFIKQQKPTQ
jgi:membrane-associated phospholipid phosphatase